MLYCCSISNWGSSNSSGMEIAVSTWCCRLRLHLWGTSKKGFGRSHGERDHAKSISQRVHTRMVDSCWQSCQKRSVTKMGRSWVIHCQETGGEIFNNQQSRKLATAVIYCFRSCFANTLFNIEQWKMTCPHTLLYVESDKNEAYYY